MTLRLGVGRPGEVAEVWTARTMHQQARLLSGRELKPAPDWFIGAVENPFAPPLKWRAERLGKKIAAGARFCQTQFIFDVKIFASSLTAPYCGVNAGFQPVGWLDDAGAARSIAMIPLRDGTSPVAFGLLVLAN